MNREPPAERTEGSGLRRLRDRLWQPPRPHGQVIAERRVSFLELFYDLIFVVVVSRAADALTADVSWRGVGDFAIVFGLIWLAWMNGTTYQDLHGREDVRSRSYVFLQMMILTVLALYTEHAADEDGPAFAVVYAVLLLVLTWLWYSVRRRDPAHLRRASTPYLIGMSVSVVTVSVSALLPPAPRLLLWALLVVAWTIGLVVLDRPERARGSGVAPSSALAERFGLFTIIVLGEVVLGVVIGILDAERTPRAVVTGLIGLSIAYAFWWTYFDIVGRRLPRGPGRGFGRWIAAHLPVTGAIAAAGAGVVSLVDHAAAPRIPAAIGWLLAGAVALLNLALVPLVRTLEDYRRLVSIYQPVTVALVGAAGAALLVGWARPAPWLLALLLVAILSAVWWVGVTRLFRLPRPDEALPG
ncbi:low temperature requirement protein A [Micromonospora sp. MS34]|uniref:low temperature requirement protein A n=1 Tax=Micromonospora sp. MS34 TaxID=3385971 RepID=UPI0039A26D75